MGYQYVIKLKFFQIIICETVVFSVIFEKYFIIELSFFNESLLAENGVFVLYVTLYI